MYEVFDKLCVELCKISKVGGHSKNLLLGSPGSGPMHMHNLKLLSISIY